MQPHKSACLWMKFLSIGCDNLCSAENDSFKTANNSSSAAVVKAWRSSDQEERGWWRRGDSVFRAQAIYWWVDSWIKCYAATNDHMDFCRAEFHVVSPSWQSACPSGWKGCSLVSRLLHMPAELRRIEVWESLPKHGAVTRYARIMPRSEKAAARPELLWEHQVIIG